MDRAAEDAVLKVGGEQGFVDKISHKMIVGQKRIGDFNADALLDLLGKADAAVAAQQAKLGDVLQTTQRYNDCVKTLRKKTGDMRDTYERLMGEEFRGLDQRTARSAAAAVRTGERLEALEQHRRRAAEMVKLLEYFTQLNCDRSELPLDPVFTDPSQLYSLAKVVHKLSPVAKELDRRNERTIKAKKEIERLVSHVETQLLEQFDRARAVPDIPKMRETADALCEFNGGSSVISRFLQSQDVFTNGQLISQDEAIAATPVPTIGEGSKEDLRVTEFAKRMMETCDKVAEITRQVFGNRGQQVMMMFLQRLIEQRIRPFIDIVMQSCSELIKRKQQQTTATSPSASPAPSSSLTPQQQEKQRQTEFQKQHRAEWVRLLNRTFVTIADKLAEPLVTRFNVPSIGDLLLDPLFASYRDTYIKTELQSLVDFYNWKLRIYDNKKGFLERAGPSVFDRHDLQQNVMPGDAPDELVSVITTLDFIHANEDAVKRCLVLSRKPQLCFNLGQMFEIMLRFIFVEYTDDALSRMNTLVALTYQQQAVTPMLPPVNKVVPVMSSYMRQVQIATQVIVLVKRYFQETLMVHLIASPSDYSLALEQIDNVKNRLEVKVINGLFACVEVLMDLIRKLLIVQNHNDYKLRDEDIPLDLHATSTCQSVVKFLNTQREEITHTLDGRNVRSFLTELGIRLQRALLEHLKTFVVSAAGSLQIVRDLNEYRDCTRKFGSEVVNKLFDILADVSKLYLVSPENIGSLLEDSLLRKLDHNTFQELVKTRSDFQTTWLGKFI